MPSPNLPAVPQPEAEPAPSRAPLVPERSDFLEGDAPAASKVEAFLAQALAATGSEAPTTAGALVPWICDALLSNHSVKAYGRDLMDFLRHMQAQGVDPLHVTADHVKLYKRALLEAGRTSATVARRLSVLRGTYKQLAAKGLVSWETAQDIAAVQAPGVQKNATPSLTQRQAIALLEAIPSDTLQGADRHRIANLFPTAHRLVFVASDRQRIASIGGGGKCCSRRLDARSLLFLRCLRPRVSAGDYAGILANWRENR